MATDKTKHLKGIQGYVFHMRVTQMCLSATLMTLDNGKRKSSSPRASRFYENMGKGVKSQKGRFTVFFDDKKQHLMLLIIILLFR